MRFGGFKILNVHSNACMLSHFSCVRLCNSMDMTVVRQAPLSMGFSRQEYWSGLPCPPPGDLPDPGIETVSCISCIAGGFFTTEPQGKPSNVNSGSIITELSFTTKVESLLQKRCSDLKIKCILGKYSMMNPFVTLSS